MRIETKSLVKWVRLALDLVDVFEVEPDDFELHEPAPESERGFLRAAADRVATITRGHCAGELERAMNIVAVTPADGLRELEAKLRALRRKWLGLGPADGSVGASAPAGD